MREAPVIRATFLPAAVTPIDALTRWIRCLPLLVVAGLATVAGVLAAFVVGACVVFTSRRPNGLIGFQVWAVRVRVRAFSAFFLLRPNTPAVPRLGPIDDGTDPYTAVSSQPPVRLSRVSPLARLVIGLPSILIGLPIGVLLDLLYPVLIMVVAVHRGWPQPVGPRLAALEQWVAHVFLYMFLATDERPSMLPPGDPARSLTTF